MITVLSRKPDDLASPDMSKVNKEIIEYCGLSTDEKPNGLIVTGSTFLEIDTGDLYIYNEETAEWVQFINIKDAAGGGGGGGSSDLTLITAASVDCSDEVGPNVYGGVLVLCDYDTGEDLYPNGFAITESFLKFSINNSSINVIWDGTLYENVPWNDEGKGWGDASFSTFPFAIRRRDSGLVIFTNTEGEHTFSISVSVSYGTIAINALDTSEEFYMAGDILSEPNPYPNFGFVSTFITTLYGGHGMLSAYTYDMENPYHFEADDEVGCQFNSETWELIITSPEASITLTLVAGEGD